MRLLRPLLGVTLLVGLISLVDPHILLATLQRTDLMLFGVALLLAIIANFICAYRWKLVAKELGIFATYRFMLCAYAQGISVNSVLPGGVIGGDAWRSVAISEKAPEGSKHLGVLSVFLDRVSGLWGLTWLSLLAGLLSVLVTFVGSESGVAPTGATSPEIARWFESPLAQVYLCALLLIALAPLLGRLIYTRWLYWLDFDHHRRSSGRWLMAMIQIINAQPVLTQTLLLSVVTQALTATAFWLCLASVGIHGAWLLFTTLCGGVFLSAVLPAAFGGFGAREVGAVAFITPFGFDIEGVIAGSILFGFTATIQGVLGLWFWLGSRRNSRTPGVMP